MQEATLTIAGIADTTPPRPLHVVSRAPTILVVDDSRLNRSSLAELLCIHGVAGECLVAEDGFHAFKMLRTHKIDLVVCDLNMPRCDGLRFLQLKNAVAELVDIPVIVLTGSDDSDRKVHALTSGASDYVTKPYASTELIARINVHLKLRQLQQQLLTANEELLRLTHTDALTGVKNRRFLMDKLQEELLRARRYDRPLSIAMFDIDHFKALNDVYGHLAGDAALVEVAALFGRTLRAQDVLARYGGEEFVVIMPETDAEGGCLAAERVRKALESHTITCEGKELAVTVSGGVAAFPHPLVATAPDLIRLADAALYDSKHSGRNRITRAI